MFSPTRDQARKIFFDTWTKYQAQQPIEGAESLALEAILAHPEYHHMLNDPERYLDQDYPPELNAVNPFLHLFMHVAIAEQLSIDQPPGIRLRYESLLRTYGDAMTAQHVIMECLAEMIWQAQRQRGAFDPTLYMDCLDSNLK
jgi:Domain of unknown function (DUF1841)